MNKLNLAVKGAFYVQSWFTRFGYQFTSENSYGPTESLICLSEHRIIVLQWRRQRGNLLSSKQDGETEACRAWAVASYRNITFPDISQGLMPAFCKGQPGKDVFGVSIQQAFLVALQICSWPVSSRSSFCLALCSSLYPGVATP